MWEGKDVFAVLVGMLSYLIGGWDTTLQVLTILMALDVITGCWKAWMMSDFASRSFREGLMTKAGFFFVLILAFQIDVMVGNTEPVIRTVVCIYYIGVEGTSLIENIGACGIPIPSIIKRHLKSFQEREDIENAEDNEDTDVPSV